MRTRREVLEAATRLFAERGYGSTTMGDIAEAAGVSTETVYASVGPKPEVLKQAIDVAIAGDDLPIPLNEREVIHEIQQAPTARAKFRLFATLVRSILGRLAPLWQALEQGAAQDEALAALVDPAADGRLQGMTEFAANLEETGCLRDGRQCRGGARCVVGGELPAALPAVRDRARLDARAVRGVVVRLHDGDVGEGPASLGVASLDDGGMAERTIATVLKTVDGQPSGGSNPPPSARAVPLLRGSRCDV